MVKPHLRLSVPMPCTLHIFQLWLSIFVPMQEEASLLGAEQNTLLREYCQQSLYSYVLLAEQQNLVFPRSLTYLFSSFSPSLARNSRRHGLRLMEWVFNPIRCCWLVTLLHQHMGTRLECLSTTMGYVEYRYISFITVVIVVVVVIHMKTYVSQNHSKKISHQS